MRRGGRSDVYGTLQIRIHACNNTILTSVRVKWARRKGRRRSNRTCIADKQPDKELGGGTWVLTTCIFKAITDGTLSYSERRLQLETKTRMF
jgi:hypothetical protein